MYHYNVIVQMSDSRNSGVVIEPKIIMSVFVKQKFRSRYLR